MTTIACSGDGATEPAPGAGNDEDAMREITPSESVASIESGYAPIGVDRKMQKIKYAVVDGMAVFEGDIILGTAEEIAALGDLAPLGVAITGSTYRWPNKTVPYTIDSGLTNQARVTDAMAHWQSKTAIRFVRRTSANASQYPNYVTFRANTGCSAHVGRRGGQQYVNLGTGCTTGNTIHEIGHALGLWHEHGREDRDNFVTIRLENVQEGYEYAFDKHISDGTDIGTYDYGSIMHYGRTAFSKNGQPTIVAKNGASIGQRTALSARDVSSIGTMYP